MTENPICILRAEGRSIGLMCGPGETIVKWVRKEFRDSRASRIYTSVHTEHRGISHVLSIEIDLLAPAAAAQVAPRVLNSGTTRAA